MTDRELLAMERRGVMDMIAPKEVKSNRVWRLECEQLRTTVAEQQKRIAELGMQASHWKQAEECYCAAEKELAAAQAQIKVLREALEYVVREQEREGFGDEMPDIKQAREALAQTKEPS